MTIRRLAILLLLASPCACGVGSAGPDRGPSDQQLAALRDTPDAEHDALGALTAEVEREPRDEAWAGRTEAALRASFVADGAVPRNALTSTMCRRSRCVLTFALPPTTPPHGVLEDQIAIDRWISTSQSCPYTLTTPLARTRELGHFVLVVDCRAERLG